MVVAEKAVEFEMEGPEQQKAVKLQQPQPPEPVMDGALNSHPLNFKSVVIFISQFISNLFCAFYAETMAANAIEPELISEDGNYEPAAY